MSNSTSNRLGIMVLDRKYRLVAGNAGREDSYPFPVITRTIAGLYNPPTIPVRHIDGTLSQEANRFLQCAQQLEKEQVKAIIASCGFFSAMQEIVNDAISVPLYTSPLLLIGVALSTMESRGKCGILTLFGEVLEKGYLDCIRGYERDRVVLSDMSEAHEFRRMITEDRDDVDEACLRREVLEGAERLVESDARISSIVIECSDMTPYSESIRKGLGLPVYDYFTLARIAYYSNGIREAFDE